LTYLDLWAPTASLLQGLTVTQQYLYQMMFKNVYEFKKQLVKSVLVWSRISILPSVHGEIVCMPALAQWADILSNFTAGSWQGNI